MNNTRIALIVILLIFINSTSTFGQNQINKTEQPSDTLKDLGQLGIVCIGNPMPDNDRSKEEGYILYQLTIDNHGKLIDIKVLGTTLTEKTEMKYRKKLKELTFKKADSSELPPITVGTIRITIGLR